jgi:hypothetical protein
MHFKSMGTYVTQLDKFKDRQYILLNWKYPGGTLTSRALQQTLS